MKIKWMWFPSLLVKNNPRLVDIPLNSVSKLLVSLRTYHNGCIHQEWNTNFLQNCLLCIKHLVIQWDVFGEWRKNMEGSVRVQEKKGK